MTLTAAQVKGLNNMNVYAQRAALGTVLGTLGPVGNVKWLDPANGSDSNSGTAAGSAFKTIEKGLASLTGNQNDVLVYLAGASSSTILTTIDWNLSYTHLVGYCAPTRVAQRARFFQTSASSAGTSPLFTVSGSSCILKDFYIFQGVVSNTSTVDVSVTGQRNYFENVHFAGAGDASQAIAGGASLNLSGASENTFVKCTIGTDTAAAATGLTALSFGNTTTHTVNATRNYFDNCVFRVWANSTGVTFVNILELTAITGDNIFDKCLFINRQGTGGTSVLASAVTGTGSATGTLFFKDCIASRITTWDVAASGNVMGNMNAVTGAALSGVAVALHA